MKEKSGIVAVVGNEKEAREVLKIAGPEATFIATNLEAEFCLEKEIPGYKNPIYDLIKKNESEASKNYIFDNFEIAFKFCGDNVLRYFRVRLGYFLAELERSLDLAEKAISEFQPKYLIIGSVKNFPGSSVTDGTLKTNAFMLLAKEKKIPHKLINNEKTNYSIRQTIGRKIQLLWFSRKQIIPGSCDLLILTNPRHLIQMEPIIKTLKNKGISVSILTYSVTVPLKNRLDQIFPVYFEKERLLDSKVKAQTNSIIDNLTKRKAWNKFTIPKYSKNSTVINYMKWKIEDIIKNEMPELLTDFVLADKVLDNFKPKALLTTTDPDSKVLPYIDKARERGIKTICVQHGAFYGKNSPAIYPVSEFFITWSNITKNWLEKSGHFKKVKMLVGSSPFHKLSKRQHNKDTSRQLTILFLSTKNVFDKSLVAFYQRKLFDVLSETEVNFRFLVRVHPYQNTSNLKSLMENFNHDATFDNNCSLEESLNKSDLVIYENTTAGFDAMLLAKPTVYFNPYTGEDYFNVNRNKASFLVLNMNDLKLKLPNFIKEQKQWKKYSKRGSLFAKKYLGLDSPTSKIPETVKRILSQ